MVSIDAHCDGCATAETSARDRFCAVYRKSVSDVLNFWTEQMQEEIARHCHPWRQGATNFQEYLIASETRYWIAYESLLQTGDFESVCDVGGFFGAYALTLARLGYRVAMTETLNYYSESFSPLFDFLQSNGVGIIDYDPFSGPAEHGEKFDVISVMAVLEHYPHSLRTFMGNMLEMVRANGRVYVEVPNIAYWPKRLALLRGDSPLVPIDEIYRSAIPFIGHHHEFTMQELLDLAALSGLKVLKTHQFNYSFRGPLINRLYSEPILYFMSKIPSMRECLAMVATPV